MIDPTARQVATSPATSPTPPPQISTADLQPLLDLEVPQVSEPVAITGMPKAWSNGVQAMASVKEKDSPGTFTASGEATPLEEITGTQRYDNLREQAAYLSAVLDGDALDAAVASLNARLPEPGSEAEVRAAISDRQAAPRASVQGPAIEDDAWLAHFGNDLVLNDTLEEAAYIGPVGEFVDRVCGVSTYAPKAGLFLSILTILSGHLGNRGNATWQGMQTRMPLYAIALGDTGHGKGMGADIGIDVVQKATQRTQLGGVFSGSRILSSVNSGEGLVRELMDLREIHGSTPAVAILEEFATVLKAKNREASTLGQYIRLGFDGRPLSRSVADRRSSGRVDQPALAFLGNITPHELRLEATEVDAAAGLLNRFILVPVVRMDRARRLAEKTMPTAEIEAALADVLTWAYSPQRKPLEYTDAALGLAQAVDDWQQQRSAAGGLIGRMSQRTTEHVLRVAQLLAITEMSDEITSRHMEAAVAILDASDRTIRAFWGTRIADPVLATMMATVRRALPEGAWASALWRNTAHSQRDRRQKALSQALDDGTFRKVKAVGTRGYRVLPGPSGDGPGLWDWVVGGLRG